MIKSRRPRQEKRPTFLICLIIFIAAFLAAFFVAKFFTSGFVTNLFFTPGVVTYDESLSESEVAFLKPLLEGTEDTPITLKHDVLISASEGATPPKDTEHYLTYDILVPVADFYYAPSNISSAELTTTEGVQLISISTLQHSQKLLSLDGYYFFDDFTNGAVYRSLIFTGSDPAESMDLIRSHLPTFPTKDTTLSLTQTGVTALARLMVAKLNSVGDATYFTKNIADYLSSADLTHLSNEVSFASPCNSTAGSVVLCADPRMADAITAVGADIIELTGNHNNDYGQQANLDTIAKYAELGLETFGGGKDEATAAKPLEIDQKSAKITLLGYNQSTSTKANGQGASGSKPGANIYSREKAAADIATAKARGDFIIVDVQYFECYSYPDYGAEMPSCDAPISGQQELFRDLIDLGADMVIGTQAHQPQTFELYNGKPIYYGLGNLFFDQTHWPGTTRGIILTHYFVNGKYVQTRLAPTVYDKDLQVKLMDEEDSIWFINRLNQAR